MELCTLQRALQRHFIRTIGITNISLVGGWPGCFWRKRWTHCQAALCFQGLAPRWSMYMEDHVASFILLPGNEGGIILHVTKQNKQTNKNVFHSYQGLHSLGIRWPFWNVKRKISKSIRYLENKMSQEPNGQRWRGPNSCSPLQKECKNFSSRWVRFKVILSIKTMKKKNLEVKCVTQEVELNVGKHFLRIKSPKLNFEHVTQGTEKTLLHWRFLNRPSTSFLWQQIISVLYVAADWGVLTKPFPHVKTCVIFFLLACLICIVRIRDL